MSPNGDATGRRSPRRRLLLLGSVALLLALAGCGGPQPAPEVCYGCTDGPPADALPPNATTGDSVTHLYLAPESGEDPRVVTRTRVGLDTAEELRTNASRREAIRDSVLAARAIETRDPDSGVTTPTPQHEGPDGRSTYPVPAFEARDLSVGTETDRLVVDFRVAGIPDVEPAETPPLVERGVGGAVLVDRFNIRDGRNPHPSNDGFTYTLASDRLVVHAPPGTEPVVVPDGATVRGDRVVLRSLPADTTLVFAPTGTGGTLAAHATLTADTLGWVVPDSFWVALLPLLQFGVLLRGLEAEKRGNVRYAVAALLLALLPAVAPLLFVAGPMGLLAIGVVVVLAFGGYLLWRDRRGSDGEGDEAPGDGVGSGGAVGDGAGGRLPTVADVRAGIAPWVGPVAIVAVAAIGLTVAAAALTGETPLSVLLFLGGGVLPVAGFVGLGWLDGGAADRPRQHRLLVLLVLVAPWLFAVGHVAGRGVPDGLSTLVLILVWGSGATLVGFLAHRIAGRVSASRAA